MTIISLRMLFFLQSSCSILRKLQIEHLNWRLSWRSPCLTFYSKQMHIPLYSIFQSWPYSWFVNMSFEPISPGTSFPCWAALVVKDVPYNTVFLKVCGPSAPLLFEVLVKITDLRVQLQAFWISIWNKERNSTLFLREPTLLTLLTTVFQVMFIRPECKTYC